MPKVSASPAVFPVAVMSLSMKTLPAASSVSVVLALHLIGAATVMLPAWVPGLPARPVETVTPVLARALVRVVMLITVSSAAAAKPAPLSAAAEMVTSCGSISQLPVLPLAASVVTLTSGATVTLAAEVSTAPPSPSEGAEASMMPPTLTSPPCIPASSATWPALPPMVCASTVPVLATTDDTAALAPCAVISTCPPLAEISPPFSTSAAVVAPSTSIFRCPLAPASSVTLAPAARTASPPRALMVPWLDTVPPISTTDPPSRALMVPWLTTEPVAPLAVKTSLPAMKSWSAMSAVEATSPPTLTCALLVNSTPLGLTT